MTTNSLLRVIATALAFTAACKSDFQAGINGNDGSAQEVAVSHDSGSPADSVPWSCDPFSPITKPITLTNVLGAGRDTDGTLYVVDQPQPGGERVFVSSGGTLQRQRIDGSGTESSGGGVMSYTLFVSDLAGQDGGDRSYAAFLPSKYLKQFHATYAQMLIKNDWQLLPIPDGMSYEHAAMACCAAGKVRRSQSVPARKRRTSTRYT